MPDRVVVALDWSPNTNHLPFYVAEASGLYRAAGLDVELRPPDASPAGAAATPARQVAAGQADVAVAPSESAVSFATTEPGKRRLAAVAALVQGSTSSIATLAASGIDAPAKLAGRRYASYAGRFEDAIVAAMVARDGGDGASVRFRPLGRHGYDEASTMGAGSAVASYLQRGEADATWIFSHWEGVLARRAGVALNELRLEDSGVPYGYSPVLLADVAGLDDARRGALRRFLAATAEGAAAAAADPAAAAAALAACGHPSLADAAFVVESATAVAPSLLDADGRWGRMEEGRWTAFVDFLSGAGILVDRGGAAIPRAAVDAAALFTNEFLPGGGGG